MSTHKQNEIGRVIEEAMETPPVDLERFYKERIQSRPERRAIVNRLESLAGQAATAARYLDVRIRGGDHADGVKAFNKTGRVLYKKGFGYNEHRNIEF